MERHRPVFKYMIQTGSLAEIPSPLISSDFPGAFLLSFTSFSISGLPSVLSDMRGPAGHWTSCGHPCAERAVWNPKFCVVTDYQMLLLDKEEVLCNVTERAFAHVFHMPLQFFLTGYKLALNPFQVLNIGVNRVQSLKPN